MNPYSLPLLCILLAGNTVPAASDCAQTHQECSHKKQLIDEVSLDEVHLGTPEIDLRILNSYGERPRNIQNLFITARKSLSSDPAAAFAENAAILQASLSSGLTHLGGPMLGDVKAHGAKVWVRTIKPAPVCVIVQTQNGPVTYGPVNSTVESDLTAVVLVDGLLPDTPYPYHVTVDGKPIDMPESATIRTHAAPGIPTKMKLAFGSCLHKRGFVNHSLLGLIRERGNAAMLLFGDLAVDDRNNHLGLHRSDYLLRDLSVAWQAFSASIPAYAQWDDHDYFDNDLAGIPKSFTDADRRSVRKVWMQNWNNPSYGFGDEQGGIFFRTRIGPADLIMLDTRYFREGDPWTEGSQTTYLGEAQMQWLEQELLKCKGPFIILTSGTMWSDYISNGKDSWGVWDKPGRERVLSFIEKHKIPGVLLLSGDRHGARGFRIPRESGHTFYEFEPASLGGLHGPPIKAKDCSEQLFGFAHIYAFGELEFDTTIPDPEVTFRLIKSDGTQLHETRLSLSQLTPPDASE